ncbi:hypothetical protein L7F22_028078 [Adiantum nelumboides]|nr:hypothetical protein [Adiantum nelumboides]
MLRGTPHEELRVKGMYGAHNFCSASAASHVASQEMDSSPVSSADPQLGSVNGSPTTSPGDMVKEAFHDAKQSNDLTLSNYWGITPKSIARDDGSAWPWRSFMPWETYTSDTTIDLKRHHVPDTFIDKAAYWTVKSLRVPTDIFFRLASFDAFRYLRSRCRRNQMHLGTYGLL